MNTRKVVATLKIKNKKTYKQKDCDIYVGRPSKWGNPYSHKEGTLAKYKTETREEAISCFETYFRDLLEKEPGLKAEILRWPEYASLVCWCSPLSCHAEILLKIREELKA